MKKLAVLSILGALLALTGIASHAQEAAPAIAPTVQQPAVPAETSPAEGVSSLVASKDAPGLTVSPEASALPTASPFGVLYASCTLTIAAEAACGNTWEQECWCDCYAATGRNAYCISYCGCP